MTIYLDYIFLENLIVNTVIIIETVKFTKSKISSKRKIIFIIIDTILSCLVYLNSFLNNYFIHIIFSIIVLFILFKPKNIYQLFKKVSCYYLLYFLYIGLLISINIIFNIELDSFNKRIFVYFICAVIFHYLCNDLWRIWKLNITNSNLSYTLEINGKKIEGFVDTGNTVKDIVTSLSVIFIDSSKKYIINENLEEIYFDVITVNGKDRKAGYIAKDIIVYKGKKYVTKLDKIILSFSLNSSNTPEKYSAIIGYNTYIEKLEGVKL